MKKVISVALFGPGDRYAQYLPALALGHLNLYPRDEDWSLRVHVGCVEDRWIKFLSRLCREKLIEITFMHPWEVGKCEAMLWRLEPLFDPGVDYVFCRDLDAPPMPRDRACMEQFIRSEAMMHTVHDAPVHVGVMGGLCGFRVAELRRATDWKALADVYRSAGDDVDWSRHGADQDVLNRLVFGHDHTSLTLLEHRYAGWHCGPRERRRALPGSYRCQSWSAPVPDDGYRSHPLDLVREADLLGAHLGCADYDYTAARAFWEEHGDPAIARLVRECEG